MWNGFGALSLYLAALLCQIAGVQVPVVLDTAGGDLDYGSRTREVQGKTRSPEISHGLGKEGPGREH